MKKFLVFLLVLVVAAAVAAEIAAPPLVEAQLEAQARARTRGAAGVEADVDSFPFLPGVLLEGRIRRVSVTLDQVVGQALPFLAVGFELRGVELDQSALWQREVRLRSIDAGVFTARLTDDALAGMLGPALELTPGTRLPEVELPGAGDLLPCAPSGEVSDGQVELTCEFSQVPSLLQPVDS
ncbi:MAG TPA: LmeA family phospholipid-binding protein [Egibacteraceae bacterium]|nr:LmeA family phospholipid-binding protein [Egibacteraceae bacterium]